MRAIVSMIKNEIVASILDIPSGRIETMIKNEYWINLQECNDRGMEYEIEKGLHDVDKIIKTF